MYVFFNLIEGGEVGVETETVQAVIPYLDEAPDPSSLIILIGGDRVPVIGAPSYVVGELGTGSGPYAPFPLIDALSGPLPPWGLDAYVRVTGTVPTLRAYAWPTPATSMQFLGDPPSNAIIVQGDPHFIAGELTPAFPGGDLPVVEALILADGTVPYQRRIGGTSHVSGSGDYEITLGAEAAGGFIIPSLTPFGAPVTSPIFLSWSSTGPGTLVVYVRDETGAPVDAPFGLFGIASVTS